jgi:ribonuclease HI
MAAPQRPSPPPTSPPPGTPPGVPGGTANGETPLDYVQLYTDGACKGNPGPGGWAYILKHPASGKQREDAGGEAHTTNNRMELMGVIRGLEVMRLPLTVDLYSDSQYVLKGLSQWMKGWKRGGWRTADGQPVKNRDLWMQLDELMARHTVRFHWVRGHSGHPENERCDRLAVAARNRAG